jgi:ABC-type transport system involved in multi-copper enzyme maturation permease subunit
MTAGLWIGFLLFCVGRPWLFYLALTWGSGDTAKVPGMTGELNLADQIAFPGALQGTVDAILAYGLPFLILLGASAFGGEYAWGTLRLWLTRGEGRHELVLSKLAALGILWVTAVVTGAALGCLSAFVVAGVANLPGPATISLPDALRFGGRLLSCVAAGWAYLSLTGLMTVQTRSTAQGVAFGLLAFFGDRIASAAAIASTIPVLEWLGRAGLNYNVRSLTGGAGDEPNSLPLAVTLVAFYLVMTAAGAVRKLESQDITMVNAG